VAGIDLHELVGAVVGVALELDLRDAVIAELLEQAQAGVGQLVDPDALGEARRAEGARVLAQLAAGEHGQRLGVFVHVGAHCPQLVVAAGDDLLQHERAAVGDAFIRLRQRLGGRDLEHRPLKAAFEGQRLDRLEDRRKADGGDLGGLRRQVVGRGHEHRLRRADADPLGGADLLLLVGQTDHRPPVRERHDVVGGEAFGVARDDPDVLVVGGEDDRASRQAPAEVLEEEEERLGIGDRVGAECAGGVARVEAQGAGALVEGQHRHALGPQAADDTESVGERRLQHDRRRRGRGSPEKTLQLHLWSPCRRARTSS
jgi:hypothetical protein